MSRPTVNRRIGQRHGNEPVRFGRQMFGRMVAFGMTSLYGDGSLFHKIFKMLNFDGKISDTDGQILCLLSQPGKAGNE